VVTFEQFANELKVYEDDKECSNKPIERVKIALNDVMLNKPYDLLINNCQTLTNKACNNVSKSDDGLNVLLITLFATLLIVIIAAVIGNHSNQLSRT
jgi:formyltetrahydrofolate hydrolase